MKERTIYMLSILMLVFLVLVIFVARANCDEDVNLTKGLTCHQLLDDILVCQDSLKICQKLGGDGNYAYMECIINMNAKCNDYDTYYSLHCLEK